MERERTLPEKSRGARVPDLHSGFCKYADGGGIVTNRKRVFYLRLGDSRVRVTIETSITRGLTSFFLLIEPVAIYRFRRIDVELLTRVSPAAKHLAMFPLRKEKRNANYSFIFVNEIRLEHLFGSMSLVFHPFDVSNRSFIRNIKISVFCLGGGMK